MGVVLGPAGCCDREERPAGGESGVQRGAGFAEEVDEIGGLGLVGRVFPVDV